MTIWYKLPNVSFQIRKIEGNRKQTHESGNAHTNFAWPPTYTCPEYLPNARTLQISHIHRTPPQTAQQEQGTNPHNPEQDANPRHHRTPTRTKARTNSAKRTRRPRTPHHRPHSPKTANNGGTEPKPPQTPQAPKKKATAQGPAKRTQERERAGPRTQTPKGAAPTQPHNRHPGASEGQDARASNDTKPRSHHPKTKGETNDDTTTRNNPTPPQRTESDTAPSATPQPPTQDDRRNDTPTSTTPQPPTQDDGRNDTARTQQQPNNPHPKRRATRSSTQQRTDRTRRKTTRPTTRRRNAEEAPEAQAHSPERCAHNLQKHHAAWQNNKASKERCHLQEQYLQWISSARGRTLRLEYFPWRSSDRASATRSAFD